MSSETAYEFAALQPPPGAAVHPVGHDPVALARAEADEIREHARRVGEEEGRRLGMAQAQAQVEPALTAIGQTLTELGRIRGETAERVERAAVELALQIAGKVVAGVVDARPEVVLDVIGTGLRGLVEREQIVVLVNPDDLPVVRGALEDLVAQLGGIERIEVQAERRVARGGAVLRTETGEIDATLDGKLERVRESIAVELEDRAA